MTITRKHVLWALVALCLGWAALVGGWAGSQEWSDDDGYAAGGVIGLFVIGWVAVGIPAGIMAALQRTTSAVLLIIFGPLTVLAVSAMAVAL